MVRRSSGGTRLPQGPIGVGEGVMVGVGVRVMVGVVVGVVVWVGGTAVAGMVAVARGVLVWAGGGTAVESWTRAACLVIRGVGVVTAAVWQAINQSVIIDNRAKVFRMRTIVADAVVLSSILNLVINR